MSYLHLIIKKYLSFQYSPYAERDGGKHTSDISSLLGLKRENNNAFLEKESEEYYFKIDIHSLGITHRNVFWFIVKDKRLGA